MRGAIALLITAGAASWARAGEQVLKFADPSSPGKIVIQMGLGDVQVTGADVTEVTLTSSEESSVDSEPRDDGLRRLNAGNSYGVTHEGNTITIRASGIFGAHRHFGSGAPNDIMVQVPRGTGVKVERMGPGDIMLENLAGDVEIRAMSGDVSLVGLSGGAVIETMNGDVEATFARVADAKPISISTANGDVELRVPADSKATVRFRTLRGDMLTDFGADQLKTLTEDVVGVEGGSALSEQAQAEIDRELAREEARRAKEEARQAREEAKRASAASSAGTVAPVPPIPPIPPMPHFPSVPVLSGGEVIAGDLNGGGTGITVTTLSGDIVFRKAK